MTADVAARRANHYHLGTQRPFNYCYIRKNGCSAFKRLFVAQSPHDFASSGLSEMAFMVRHHRATDADLSLPTVLILRDPFERIASAFLNQFIMRLGRNETELHESVAHVTGTPPADLSFGTFVEGYVLKAGAALDRHFHPQASHVLPMAYSHVLSLGDVARGMAGLLGERIATEFFGKPVNAAQRFELKNHGGDAHTPAGALASAFAENKALPPKSALLTAETRARLAPFLQQDAALWHAFQSADQDPITGHVTLDLREFGLDTSR